ncbi:hypothetical protein Tco_0012999 [Tanacetum coccineum]
MAVPNGGNQIARRVIDDLIEFSGQTSVDGYMSFFKSQQIAKTRGFINRMHEEANTSRNLIRQLNALIAEMEAREDQGEMFDTLMDLRDDREAVNTKLLGLNALITQAEEEIETKEAQIEAMNGAIFIVQCMGVKLSWIIVKIVCVIVGRLSPHLRGCRPFDLVDITGPCSTYEAKQLEDSWYPGLMAFIFKFVSYESDFEPEPEAYSRARGIGQRGDALKAYEGLREIVACDVVKLGVLEQLLVATRVGIPLKAGYAADMEDKE